MNPSEGFTGVNVEARMVVYIHDTPLSLIGSLIIGIAHFTFSLFYFYKGIGNSIEQLLSAVIAKMQQATTVDNDHERESQPG